MSNVSNVFLAEPNRASVLKVRNSCRKVVWGLVETIALEEKQAKLLEEEKFQKEQEEWNLQHIAAEDEILPFQFGTSKKTWVERGRKKKNDKIMLFNRLEDFPIRPNHACLDIEHNILLFLPGSSSQPIIVQVLGVGPSSPPGSTSVVRTLSGEVMEVIRTQLRAISEYSLNLFIGDESSIVDVLTTIVSNENKNPYKISIKYWDMRYLLLSKFDEGVKLDEESWYSITPECIANHITETSIHYASEDGLQVNVVLDCFSGCGGNTIPFAREEKEVISVEIDPLKLEYLRHNADVYEAKGKIILIQNDVVSYLKTLISEKDFSDIKSIVQKSVAGKEICNLGRKVSLRRDSSSKHPDLIVMSPPWGGPQYIDVSSYDIHTMLFQNRFERESERNQVFEELKGGDIDIETSGIFLGVLAASICPNFIFILPRNTDNKQLELIGKIVDLPFHIELIFLNDKLKLKAVYFGAMYGENNDKKSYDMKGKNKLLKQKMKRKSNEIKLSENTRRTTEESPVKKLKPKHVYFE